MKLLKLLTLPIARAKVSPSLISEFAGKIETDFEVDHPSVHAKYPKSIYLRLAQEAYRRAAAKESDQIPRQWGMVSQVEDISTKLGLIANGARDLDPELETILRYFEPLGSE